MFTSQMTVFLEVFSRALRARCTRGSQLDVTIVLDDVLRPMHVFGCGFTPRFMEGGLYGVLRPELEILQGLTAEVRV